MNRLLIFALLLSTGWLPGFATPDSTEVNAERKKLVPAHPEHAGLRLEVTATLEDEIASDGTLSSWHAAILEVEVALHNISSAPITVPTKAFEEKPLIDSWTGKWDGNLESIRWFIESPKFQGKPTAFVSARFEPVVLAPGEYVLLLKHSSYIKDRKRADAIKEVAVLIWVSKDFVGPADWWRGSLQVYAPIQRHVDPDREIERQKAAAEKYKLQMEAEMNPDYGRTNAARVAALIAGSDEVRIKGEMAAKETEVVSRDLPWIKRVSEVIARTPLPKTVSCMCIGWRTFSFYKEGEKTVSLAAIHGNQLRIHFAEASGDYPISEAQWNEVNQALDLPLADRPAQPKKTDAGH